MTAGNIAANGGASRDITVYSPNSPLREPREFVRSMVRDVVLSRELAWRLFVRDVSAQYRQSVLGYVWALLPPIATTAIFSYLNSQRILNVGNTATPYPAFVMIGTLLWQTFLDALNSPLRSVNNSRAMMAKVNFPREALIVSGLADVLFNTAVRIALLAVTFAVYQLPLTSSLLLVPIGLFSLLVLGLAIGVLVTPMGLLYSDVGRAIGLASGFWMLLTPVVYPPPTSGLGAFLARWNPVSPIVLTTREWLTAQPTTSFTAFWWVTGLAALGLVIGWVLFRLSVTHVVERLGN